MVYFMMVILLLIAHWAGSGHLSKLHWNVGPHHLLQSTSGLRHNPIALEMLFSCPADIPMQPLSR